MTDSHTSSRTRGPVTRVILRICGWICGGIAAFAAAFWAVTATADLALSAGVYGTPGTYTVSSCHDTNNSRKNSDYDCYGDFTPDADNADDAVYVRLEDTGNDYPDGTKFDARQGLEPQTIQRAGIRGIVGELWQIGFAVAALVWLAYLVIKPPKSDKPNESRKPSRREKAADQVGGGIVVCVAVGILGWIANLAVSIAS